MLHLKLVLPLHRISLTWPYFFLKVFLESFKSAFSRALETLSLGDLISFVTAKSHFIT